MFLAVFKSLMLSAQTILSTASFNLYFTDITAFRKMALFLRISGTRGSNPRHCIATFTAGDGRYIYDDHAKSELFASFFGHVFKMDSGNLPPFPAYMQHYLDIVGVGLDLVSGRMLANTRGCTLAIHQETCDRPLLLLMSFVQARLVLGIVPNAWKTAVMVPLPKKHPLNRVSNYRPISLARRFQSLGNYSEKVTSKSF